MRQELIELVTEHEPFDRIEARHKETTLAFLKENRNCTSKTNLNGHITASAWILCPDKQRTLLTHHKKLDRWLQLGGHIESDSSVQLAALREAREESGIEALGFVENTVFDIDVHNIPGNTDVPSHVHYDLRFLLIAENANLIISDESNDLRWIELNSVDKLVSDISIIRMVKKTAFQIDVLNL